MNAVVVLTFSICIVILSLSYFLKFINSSRLPSAEVGTKISSGNLNGLLLDAGEKSPVVIIVPGSGPTDLNGNSPLGVSANTYKHLAYSLLDKGISTVRVDKRGMFSSSNAGDPNSVSVEIYANDYIRWSYSVREQLKRDSVYLLGHSEGALMVSAAAAKDSTALSGLILISGVGRPMDIVVLEQLEQQITDFEVLNRAKNILAELKSGRKVDVEGLHPTLQVLFAPLTQDYIISILKYTPYQLVKSIDVDMLVIHGTNDLQVSTVDAEMLGTAGNARLLFLEGVNHVLKKSAKNRKKNLRTYRKPNIPVSRTLINGVVSFINECSDEVSENL